MDDANHFIGEYAFEITPHWMMFTVTSSGTTFALNAMGQFHMGDFQLHKGELTGIVDGGPVRLSREDGSNRYILRGEARKSWPEESTETVPVEVALVKRLPSPGSTWEEKFGVTAADLVRRVRESEQWMHRFETLHIVTKVTVTRTPEGIEHHKKELKVHFPGEDVTPERFPDLAPSEEGREELHIDRRRFRHSTVRRHNREESIQVWDGRTCMTYRRDDTMGRETQGITPDLGDHGAPLLCGLAWPRAQRHKFWWTGNAPDEIDEGDQFGRPEDFVLMGQQDYHGVPCYVLECFVKHSGRVHRWLVGVEDSLLRGNLRYAFGLTNEYWTDRYEEIEPGCWFPIRQGYSNFDYDAGLQPFLSGHRDITVTEIAMNEEFPDNLFRIALKEGVRMCDHRFDEIGVYNYRKDMTEEEWEQIRAEARKRAKGTVKRPPITG